MDIPIITKVTNYKNREVMHKWTDEEVRILLDCMIERGTIGLPADRAYYDELTVASKLPIKPNVTRQKVRYLRSTYLKTVSWLQRLNERGVQQWELADVRQKVREMCPFYARLRHIFGNKLSKSESAEDKTSTDSIKELEFDAFLAALDVNIIEPKLDLESPDFEELTLESTTITNHYLSNINNDLDDKYAERILDDYNSPPASTATNLKSSNSRGQISAVEDVDILRKARLHLESEKLEFERYKFDKMLELKKLEMDRNYELRKLKLEQEERFINLKRKYHDIFDTS